MQHLVDLTPSDLKLILLGGGNNNNENGVFNDSFEEEKCFYNLLLNYSSFQKEKS